MVLPEKGAEDTFLICVYLFICKSHTHSQNVCEMEIQTLDENETPILVSFYTNTKMLQDVMYLV